eukprot:TRINITY_DN68416_c0_g1_i1.p1 TRINITY_DN68416_c0_g1~~TRINITY_DN68416_c0_g1_i1.p1  ORF type:complete len:334 (+),score=132.18 TRINITY_DN68416_c0_g1_i1:102-1103(+)
MDVRMSYSFPAARPAEAAPTQGVSEVPKPHPQAAEEPKAIDYTRFDAVCQDLSDDESPEQKTNRMTLEAATPEDKRGALNLFTYFDTDGNGFWSYSEAHEATKTLERSDLTTADYNEKCETFGCDPDCGWPLEAVQCMYLQSESTLAGLVKHTQVLNELVRGEEGVRIETYAPRDAVECYIDMLWKPAVIHTVAHHSTDPSKCLYDVVLTDGRTGTRDVPASCLRQRHEGYTGPTGLRSEGKKMAATHYLDPSYGVMHPKDLSAGAQQVALTQRPASSLDHIGDKVIDEVPERSNLPEDPVKRLPITIARTGLEDETTGFLSKEKVRKLLGQR